MQLPSSFKAANEQEKDFFVPKLCESEALLTLIVLAELLVLIIVLAEPLATGFDWTRFALISLFVQWIVLLSAGLICWLRPFLVKMRASLAGLVCSLGIVSITLLFTYLAQEYFLIETSVSEPMYLLYIRYALISWITSAIFLRYFYLSSVWQKQKQAELAARISALQARIQPHFLFNSLNSIVSLIAIDPDKAEQATLDLADLFRASLNHKTTLSNWAKELELAKRYLSVEQYRLGERLQVEWQIGSVPNTFPIPHLILQPLLENAIVHGIQPLVNGGVIRVFAHASHNQLTLRMTNPFIAAAPSHTTGNKMALTNIQARLTALFGPTAKLDCEHTDTEFTVSLYYQLAILSKANSS